MGEYCPEVIEAEWIGGARGPAVGALYRGRVKRNENCVIAADPSGLGTPSTYSAYGLVTVQPRR